MNQPNPRTTRLEYRNVRCPACRYPLRGLEAEDDVLTCPECGRGWDAPQLADGVRAWTVWERPGMNTVAGPAYFSMLVCPWLVLLLSSAAEAILPQGFWFVMGIGLLACFAMWLQAAVLAWQGAGRDAGAIGLIAAAHVSVAACFWGGVVGVFLLVGALMSINQGELWAGLLQGGGLVVAAALAWGGVRLGRLISDRCRRRAIREKVAVKTGASS